MARTRIYEGTFPTAPRPVALRAIRGARPTCDTIRERPRPSWSMLYAIALVTGVALFALEVIVPEGPVRILADLTAVLGCLVLVRLWVKTNQWSLVHAEAEDWMRPGEEAPNPGSAQGVGQ